MDYKVVKNRLPETATCEPSINDTFDHKAFSNRYVTERQHYLVTIVVEERARAAGRPDRCQPLLSAQFNTNRRVEAPVLLVDHRAVVRGVVGSVNSW
jgi:hypothetical protein